MTVTQAIISDAGVSSRFLPIVKTIPKSMLPIGNKPVIQILVEECLEAGLIEIIIVCREDTKPIYQDYFNNTREDLRIFLTEMNKPERYNYVNKVLDFPEIKFIIQDPELPYGTAAPILSAKHLLKQNEPFVYIQGDDVVLADKGDCSVLVEEYNSNQNYQAFMIAQEVVPERVHLYGSIKFKEGSDEELDFIVEKPKLEEAPSHLVSYGRFLYNYNIFDYMNSERLGKDNELWNVDALTALAKDYPVKVVRNKGEWYTTGDPLNYLKAQIAFGVKVYNDNNLAEFIKNICPN